MNTYLELIRTGNCIIASIATLIGFLIIAPASINLLFAMVAVFLICAGGQAINDVFDAEIDSKINKDKPIPSGKIKKTTALYFSILLFIVGIMYAALINTQALIISIIFSILLILYAAVLYKTKYVGNIVVALGTAFTFIFGAASAGNISLLIIVFAISAFFANMSREITKDFEDIKKDAGFKKTLPMISKKLAKGFVISYHLLAIVFSLIAFFVFMPTNFVYLIIILLVAITFGMSIKLLLANDFNNSQKKCKKGMVFSLIAFASTIIK
jgi:geranylgeranylglycerol-phosphate geranylgeranyltransferase